MSRLTAIRPTGYTLLALCLALQALAIAALMLGGEIVPLPAPGRNAFAPVVAVFAAVAAESLWFCRRWVVRACVAYVCASALAAVGSSALDGGLMPGEAVSSIIARLVIVALPLMYVHRRATKLFAQPAPAPVLPPQP
ncbi:MAG: hypothetical protein ACJ8GN_03750 [Longimicrobiaceae bacterium]